MKFQSITSLKNGENTEVATADFFNNNMELLSISPEIAMRLSDKMGISVNYTIISVREKDPR